MAFALFFFSILATGYVLAGYPLLLGYLASRHPRPVKRGNTLRSVSVIIPVHNGAEFLRRKLESVFAAGYPAELLEILVASDGSTDETESIAEEFQAQGVKLLRLPRGGKPAALNAAAALASGEILVLADVRQSIESGSIHKLVSYFDDSQVGVVSGELVLMQGSQHDHADIGLYLRYEIWIRRRLSQLDSMFGATGALYAIRRNLFVSIPEDALLDDMYLPMRAFFRGHRLLIEEDARTFDDHVSRDREFQRKARTLGGNYQLLWLLPQLLSFKNRMLWHFLSYKVGRLLLPWFLICALVSSCFLPYPWNIYALSVQAFFYLLALIDPLIPERFFLKKISSPARTFVVLMAAALWGLKVFFVSPRSLWKVTGVASVKS